MVVVVVWEGRGVFALGSNSVLPSWVTATMGSWWILLSRQIWWGIAYRIVWSSKITTYQPPPINHCQSLLNFLFPWCLSRWLLFLRIKLCFSEAPSITIASQPASQPARLTGDETGKQGGHPFYWGRSASQMKERDSVLSIWSLIHFIGPMPLCSVFILPLVYVPTPAAMKNLPFVRHLFVIQIGRL